MSTPHSQLPLSTDVDILKKSCICINTDDKRCKRKRFHAGDDETYHALLDDVTIGLNDLDADARDAKAAELAEHSVCRGHMKEGKRRLVKEQFLREKTNESAPTPSRSNRITKQSPSPPKKKMANGSSDEPVESVETEEGVDMKTALNSTAESEGEGVDETKLDVLRPQSSTLANGLHALPPRTPTSSPTPTPTPSNVPARRRRPVNRDFQLDPTNAAFARTPNPPRPQVMATVPAIQIATETAPSSTRVDGPITDLSQLSVSTSMIAEANGSQEIFAPTAGHGGITISTFMAGEPQYETMPTTNTSNRDVPGWWSTYGRYVGVFMLGGLAWAFVLLLAFVLWAVMST